MPDGKTWECPKCSRTHESPIIVNAFYMPCKCGNKREWRLKSGPPATKRSAVRSSATKEK